MNMSATPLISHLRSAVTAAVRVLFTAKHAELARPAPLFRSWWLRVPALAIFVFLLGTFARDDFAGASRYLTPLGQKEGPGWWIPALLVALHIGPALLALVRPLAAWRIAVVGALASIAFAIVASQISSFTVPAWSTGTLAYLPVVALAAVRSRRGDGTAIVAIGAVIALLGTFVDAGTGGGPLVCATLGAIAVATQAWRGQRRAERELATASATVRDEQAKRTVLEERTRIARELHDIIAHHLSLIAVRTESAPARLGTLTDEARGELAEIGTAAREALTETRQLLGVLRAETTELELGPQPGLGAVAELVEQANSSGVPTMLSMSGQQGDVPAAVQLAVYRVVQEALSNARRHAPGAAVHVRLEHTSNVISVEVDNEPPSRQPEPAHTSLVGHGLTGMRERIKMVGGVFGSGTRSDGGFRVAASIPRSSSVSEV